MSLATRCSLVIGVGTEGEGGEGGGGKLGVALGVIYMPTHTLHSYQPSHLCGNPHIAVPCSTSFSKITIAFGFGLYFCGYQRAVL